MHHKINIFRILKYLYILYKSRFMCFALSLITFFKLFQYNENIQKIKTRYISSKTDNLKSNLSLATCTLSTCTQLAWLLAASCFKIDSLFLEVILSSSILKYVEYSSKDIPCAANLALHPSSGFVLKNTFSLFTVLKVPKPSVCNFSIDVCTT